MKTLKQHLEKLTTIQRKRHHPLIHKIHKKHNISKKTLFYVKEYGPHSHVPRTILKESLKILLLASIISAFGGLALESIKLIFISIIPLLIMLPALNDMIGDYGTIISSRFSTMLHEGKLNRKWLANEELKNLFIQVLIIATITTLLSAGIAFSISYFSGYSLSHSIALKILFITLIDVLLLVNLLFVTSIMAGIYFYKKQEDPNNFLIPITTSVADFGNMILLAILISLFF